MNLKYFKYLILLLFSLLLSCEDNSKEIDEIKNNEKVIFGASIKGLLNTRTGKEMVHDQSFNLIFFSQEGFEKGTVNFNNKGIGYSNRKDVNGKFIDLEWGYVSPIDNQNNTFSFFIDNLPGQFDSATKVLFSEYPNLNPYKIGVFIEENEADPENGIYSNDLIWGSIENTERRAVEDIDLYHVMSRFCLKVYFDNSAIGEDKFPESASINNILQIPISFDRLTGNFSFVENEEEKPLPIEEPFILVENEKGWKEYYDNESKMTYYLSPDFVIAPQDFTNNQRPRLSIKLTNQTIYSGLFPLVMNIIDENGAVSPWVMSFLRGTKLTLTVKISNDAASLQFMPSTIWDWWDKGEKNLTGNQAAISKEEEFTDLINAYKNKESNKFYKWGYEDSNQKWIFNIFKSFEINANNLKGQMKEEEVGINYEFNLHKALITIILPNGRKATLTGEEGAIKLKSLLNEETLPEEDPEEIYPPEEDPDPEDGIN